VSFRDPIFLLALLLIPVAWLLYLSFQRRRAKYAVRFTNLDLLANVVQRSPGWRRHIPPALYLLALTALLVAFARPQRTESVPREQASVMMATDVSGSMQATDVKPTRLSAAQDSAQAFVDKVPKKFKVGLVTFSQTAQVVAPPTTDRGLVKDAIDSLTANGGTAMGDALDLALRSVRPGARGAGQTMDTARPAQTLPPARERPAAILLLSDGANTSGTRRPLEVARRAKALRVPINTVALGTENGTLDVTDQFGNTQRVPVPPDRTALRQIAKLSGGRYFNAPDAGALDDIYKKLGSQLGYVKVRHELTYAFAGVGLLLMLAGGVASLFWFSRFP
jgi:Ca-activated chloride channel family protein